MRTWLKIQKIGQIEFMIIVKLMRNMTLLTESNFSLEQQAKTK